ncbi:hypothetical protein ACHAXN_011176 [Cyclotella atomus]
MRRFLSAAGVIWAAGIADGAAAAAQNKLELNFLLPQMGSISGGYTINVYGNGFENRTDYRCVFRELADGASASTNATFISQEKLTCDVPSVQKPAQSKIHVGVDGNEDLTNGIPFDFIDHANITSMEPQIGPSSGRTVVKLNGWGFVGSNRLECNFGSLSVPVSWISTQQLECVVPSRVDGLDTVKVDLRLNGAKFSSNHVEFKYYNDPVVSTINPWIGTARGGTTVTITGSDFVASNISCRFGETTVAGRYNNPNAISCVAPPQFDGPVSLAVSISFNGVDYHRSPVDYKYLDPEVSSIRPRKGYLFGGTNIHVTGSNFEETDRLACFFESATDSQAITSASFVSPTEMECISPTHEPVVISSMTPASASTTGLSKVHLFGKEFFNGDSPGCRFGSTLVPAEWVSATVVICKPISLNPPAGYTTVAYTNDGVHFMDADSQFLFIHLPSISNMSPRAGLKSGGDIVRVRVDDLTVLSGWACSFGESVVQAVAISSTELSCKSPPSEDELVPVKLLLKEHDLEVDTGLTFQYYEQLQIDSIYPQSAPVSGGTPVKIAISGLRNDSSYFCVFGGVEVVADILDDSSLICNSPQFSYEEPITVRVKSVHQSVELSVVSNPISFTIYEQPVFTSAHPAIFYAGDLPDIEISGSGFLDLSHMKCRINYQSIEVIWMSVGKMVCLLSRVSLDYIGSTQLFFSPNGVDFVDTRVKLRVLPELVAASIEPSSGSTLGGITIAVTGESFHGSLRYSCHFGDDAVESRFISSTTLACVTPSAPQPESRLFRLCADDRDCVGNNITYTFVEPLGLIRVEPRRGLLEGGETVKVETNHMLSSQSYCWFGEDRVTMNLQNGTCSCVSPPFASESDTTQVVEFRVSTDGHHLSRESFFFIYHPAPRVEQCPAETNSTQNKNYAESFGVTNISPTMLVRGSPHSTLFVEGRNLLDGDKFPIASCQIGSSNASARMLVNDSDAFRCDFAELPPAGLYPVRVFSQTYGNITAPNGAKVQVIDNPTLNHLEPATIIPREITKFFVTGNNFVDHNLTCHVNEQAYRATFLSSTHILCIVSGADLMATTYQVRVSNDGHFVDASPFLLLQVVVIPYIAELNPPTGLPGSNVTLLGKGFHPLMKCHNGGGVLESRYINSSAIQCVMPLGHSNNNVQLSLALEDRPISNVANFTQVDIRVRSIHPSFGSLSGGTPLTLLLTGDVKYCRLGAAVVPALVATDRSVCTTPPMLKAGSFRVEVGVNERDFVDSDRVFEYILDPIFLHVKPSFGSELGGGSVRLIGSNFASLNSSSTIACYFGETRVIGQLISQEEIVCTTPVLKPGQYNIHVSFNGVDRIDTTLQFQARLQMTTVFARPSFGSMTGGSTIKIFGTNFRRDDNLSCKFGERVVTAKYIGPNVLECITSSHETAEAVELGVISESGDISFVENGFHYIAPFEVNSLNPDNGPIKGGTLVSLMGSGFKQAQDQILCDFGGSTVIARVISDHKLTCITPSAMSPGEINVSVLHGADIFTVVSQRFSFDEGVLLDGAQTDILSSARDYHLAVFGSFMKQKRDLACKLESEGNMTAWLEATFVSEVEMICMLSQGLPPKEYMLSVTHNGQDFSSSIAIRVVDPFKLHYTEPSIGLSGITTSVLLFGRGFEDFNGISCLLNDTHIATAHVLNSEEIRCSLPSNALAGDVSISLALDGIPVSNEHNFTFVELRVDSVHPTFGGTDGGTPVVIGLEKIGSDAVSHCKFGNVVVSASTTVNDQLVCVSPPAAEPGQVSLGLSLNGRDFETISQFFEYHSPVKLSSVLPNNGPESGGTLVRLRGANFVNGDRIVCYFGEHNQVNGTWLSESEVDCVAPPLKPAISYVIGISMNGIDKYLSSLYYRSDYELDLAMVIPALGHHGTKLAILGKSFIPADQMMCSFGDLGVMPAVYISPTEINCRIPEVDRAEMISADVRVSLNGVDFSVSSAPFHISPLPEIHSIYPNKGLVSGGAQVSVRGAHFISSNLTSPTCNFGDQSVPASVSSSTKLVCVSPATEDGKEVPFTVTMNGVDKAVVGTTSFVYLPIIKTVSIEPRSGPFTGGTLVTITGADFTESHTLKCHFGDEIVNITILNSEQIQCIAPSHPPGIVSFYVDSFNANVASDLAFEFYMPHQIISAAPTTGPYHGGTLVKIRGRHFRSDVDYTCRFGTSASTARFLSFDSIECNSPSIEEQSMPHEVMMVIADERSNHTHDTLAFTYGPPFVVDRVEPQFTFFDGGSFIAVFGKYLKSNEVWCRFSLNSTSSQVTVEGAFADKGRIDCPTPQYASIQNQTNARVQVSSNAYDWSDSLTFVYVDRPSITKIHPALGVVSGGTRVGITGSNFLQDHELWCNFRGVGSVRAEWESSESLYCTSPPLLSKPLRAAVSLQREDGSPIDDNENHFFQYHRDLSLEKVYPTTGFVTGGSKLTVFGTGFINVDTIYCHFGDQLVNALFVSPTSIECLTPSVHDPRTTELGISLNGMDVVSHRGLTFTYDSQPELERLEPDNVAVVGEYKNQYISIFGTSFVNGTNLRCMFGSYWITAAVFVNESEIKCGLPHNVEPGVYPITISSGGGDFSHNSIDFAFVKPALISSIRPSRIQEGFEAVLTISGDNFISSPDLQCRFGEFGQLWTTAAWKSNTSLECMSPPLNLTADGHELIGISNNGGFSVSALVPLEVTARARFLSMYPSHGYTTGGTDISIVLGYLRYVANRQMHCKFGDKVVPAKIARSVISCASPPNERGNVLVSLMIDGEIQPLASGTFEYLDEPLIESVHPWIGSLEGGTVVSLHGSGFKGATHCRFGTHIVPVDASFDDSNVACVSPSVNAARDVLVQITHNGQDFSSPGITFSYRARPALTDLMPSYGGANTMGKTVYISGSNFIPTPSLACRFGTSIIVDATFISDSLMSCKAVPMQIGRVPLAVSLNGVEFVDSDLYYETISLPQISSMHPCVGLSDGNTTVIFNTTALPKTDRLACNFGEKTVQATYLTSNSLSCKAPAVDGFREVMVSISVDGERLYENDEGSIEFQYVDYPLIQSIEPAFGWTVGRTNVTMTVKNMEPFLAHEIECAFGGSKSTGAIRADSGAVVCVSPEFGSFTSPDAPITMSINDGVNIIQIVGSNFRYYPPSVVTDIEPSFGSIQGDTAVKLFGTNFSNINGLRCLFNDSHVYADWISDSEVHCASPAYSGQGEKQLQVHLGIEPNRRLSIASYASFEYVKDPIIRDFYPKFGTVNGGTPVVLNLIYPWKYATDHLSCRFGNSTLTTARLISENDVECISPSKKSALAQQLGQEAIIQLHATHGQRVLSSSEMSFVYHDHIKIHSMEPASGPLGGGTTVKLRVEGLSGVDPSLLTCHFGDDATVPITLCSDELEGSLCECLTPPVNVSRSVLLELGVDGIRDDSSTGQLFAYYESPEISSVNPNVGFMEGGELIRLVGTGFRQSPTLKCLFGGLESDNVLFVTSTELYCTSPLSGNLVALEVRVSNNGVDFSNGMEYKYMHRPDASALSPSVVKWDVKTAITITGKHLRNVTSCRFGLVDRSHPIFDVTDDTISCEVPPASIHLGPAFTSFDVSVSFELENGLVPTGLDVRYEVPIVAELNDIIEPTLTAIEPAYAASVGGSWIVVRGKDFLNRRNLSCMFGDGSAQQVQFVSSSEIRCMTPRQMPGTVSLKVSNGGSADALNTGFDFTFLHDFSITQVVPIFGSVRGGTVINLYGSFPTSDVKAACRFGSFGVVGGEIVSQNHIKCLSPKAPKPDTVELSVSIDGGQNFANSSSWFQYEVEAEVLDLSPSYGYKFTNTTSSVLIAGQNFKDSPNLRCLFGDAPVTARFISNEKVTCSYPPAFDEALGKVPISVFVDGDAKPSTWRHFDYIDPPTITSYEPLFSGTTLPVDQMTVRGAGFRKMIQLFCVFGDVSTRINVLDSTTLTCPIPSHPPGEVVFDVVDQFSYLSLDFSLEGQPKFNYLPESSIHSIVPMWNSSKSGMLTFMKGSNFDTIGSAALVSLTEDLAVDLSDRALASGHDSFVLEPKGISPATNGTFISNGSSHNLTLCEPGTFQPQSGQNHCLLCPVGFICPIFGMVKPMICPAGFICSGLGLSAPSSPCVAGHYCLEGTKMASPIVDLVTTEWNLNEITGIVTAATVNVGIWDYISRQNPATGSRRIFHPPKHADVKAQQPFPCALGHYCRVGVSSSEHKEDFLTPQPCHQGYFCPRGSISPEGTGACPTGYYCATQDLATPCDVGHFCPGTGNTSPLPCLPGSFSGSIGKSSCDLCEAGYQCDGWGRSAPDLCMAGYVCDHPGISIPEKSCPSGYYCEEGTSTDDPQSLTGKPPLPCPPGLFCLHGVARKDLSLEMGLPSFDISFPEPCAEGFFCSGNASVPLGNGPCFQGHFCPTSSRYPIQVPPGTYAASGGSIVPTLCLPGTFSPRPGSISCSPCPAGFSCQSYGTFIPRICGPGTYRSKADSIPCNLCPERTYSHETGLTDVSQCLPCLEGRVCGNQGLADVQKSAVCPEGNACGYVTNRASQYDQQCVGGCFCGNETSISDQFSNYCSSGHFCHRGTSAKLSTQSKCMKSHFCALGTPSEHFMTRCPRQTLSSVGAKVIDSCDKSHVAICDKTVASLTNPFDENSYYPLLSGGDDQDDVGEMVVVKKILPFNSQTSNILPWKNETLEVFRSCPAFGTKPTSNASSTDAITVVGRNFRNSTALVCRFRLCRSSKLTYLGKELIFPAACKNDDMESNSSNPVLTKATFVTENRVECQLPEFDSLGDYEPISTTSLPKSTAIICMRDWNDNVFLSLECSEKDISTGMCVFEPAIPSFGMRKRIYSLFMPCSNTGAANDSCSNHFNPCLTHQVSVDVSNNGVKFSGDETVVISSFAVYNLVRNETTAIMDAGEKTSFELLLENDALLCQGSSFTQEGARLSENGWFLSEYMSRAIMSFDWRHIPKYIEYNRHWKLAIYVVPSRCNEAKCSGADRKIQIVENVPCLQPLELPLWFENEAIDKHQMVNLTMLSLDDALFRVEVQIIHGVALPLADFFRRTMTITFEVPNRAHTFGEVKTMRSLSPLISWESTSTPMHYIHGIRYDESIFDQISPPLNLPPRWKSFERGRMLVSMNTTHENQAPTIKDSLESAIKKNKDFWSNPFPSVLTVKKHTDSYFETWHGLSIDTGGNYKYDHESVILPFLPYFSNCREFDSYVPLWAVLESSSQCELPGITTEYPEDWWRRKIPSLPHQDDVKPVGPSSLLDFYPIADFCERRLHCSFEENLPAPDVLPRWFEADTGATLFSIIRDPISYHQYTGRDGVTVGAGDGGGQKFIRNRDALQNYIPAKVDRSPAFNVEGGCTTACFPRKVTLDISYHQVDVHTKRIVQVKVLYDRFDKDADNDRYELRVKFYALNYQELVIKFAFDRDLFLLLFSQMGIGTVIAAFVYWIVIRVTTRLEEPPSLRVRGFLSRTFPPVLVGVVLGLIPVAAVTSVVYYILKGHEHFGPDTDPEGRRWLLLPTIHLNYSDTDIDPDNLHSTRQGRTGLAFLSMALVSFYYTSRMFVPKKAPKANDVSIVTYNDDITDKTVAWRRSNLIHSSILMSFFLVVIVEWSYWGSFGTYIWEAIIFMKFLSMIVGSLVDAQLGEALLSAPVMTAMGMIQGIVTMSANDFMDFLLSYIVGFGFLILERMYIGPLQADFITWIAKRVEQLGYAIFPEPQLEAQKNNNDVDFSLEEENNETVEMLVGSVANYSCDALSLLYTPFIMVVIMIFRDEAEIIKMYGIKEADMEYYVLFALSIIPFQFIADALLHNSLELLHGWKILEYLEFCRVRFYQRETWWVGMQDSLDECIEESLRSIDQLCFSSQYYMMSTIHVNAIIYFVIGVEMMVRAKYNLFGDPALIPILGCVIGCSMTVRVLMIWIGQLFGVWRVRSEKRDWHADMQVEKGSNLDQLDDAQTSKDHDLYQMEMKITEETFRYKFLAYNRAYLTQQLPNMLTPRITQRSRPYMINQLARVLGSINADISSDSDGSDYEFEIPHMSVSTRTMARKWLVKSRLLMKLRRLVQPIIQQSRGNECDVCLSRNLLQVETLHSLEHILQMYNREYGMAGDDQLDHVLFQRYWRKNQKYQTICLPCRQDRNIRQTNALINDDLERDEPDEMTGLTGGLNESSTRIMEMWYAKATERIHNVPHNIG